jgi:hypothetical protein
MGYDRACVGPDWHGICIVAALLAPHGTWHLMTVRPSVGGVTQRYCWGSRARRPKGWDVARRQILGVGWRIRCTTRELMSRQQLLTW